jgi:hypothetical protein
MAQALRFECQPGCTECCTQRGFVYLSEQDLVRAAAFLGMAAAEFERRYVYRTRRRLRRRLLDSPRQTNAVPHLSILARTGGEPPRME